MQVNLKKTAFPYLWKVPLVAKNDSLFPYSLISLFNKGIRAEDVEAILTTKGANKNKGYKIERTFFCIMAAFFTPHLPGFQNLAGISTIRQFGIHPHQNTNFVIINFSSIFARYFIHEKYGQYAKNTCWYSGF
jgi:hypothetical protein